jgi:predicted DsbA family dithiol-disulfide isomerase
MIASQNGLQDLKRHINNTFRKNIQVQTSHGFAKKQTKSLNTFLGFKKTKVHLLTIMCSLTRWFARTEKAHQQHFQEKYTSANKSWLC